MSSLPFMNHEEGRPEVQETRNLLTALFRRRSEGQNCEQDDRCHEELHIAARAGIRLLEDNAQLDEEVKHLTEQAVSMKDEIQTLTKLLEEKEKANWKLEQHYKVSITENQQLLQENKMLKEKWIEASGQLQKKEAQISSLLFKEKRMNLPGKSKLMKEPHSDIKTLSLKYARSSPTLLPVQLKESKLHSRLEEEKKRNAALVRDLSSAQKKADQNKSLILEVMEAKQKAVSLCGETEMHRNRILQLEEERKEERKIMDSLRNVLQAYQSGPEVTLKTRSKGTKPSHVAYGSVYKDGMNIAPMTTASNQKNHGHILHHRTFVAKKKGSQTPETPPCDKSTDEHCKDEIQIQKLEEELSTVQSLLMHSRLELDHAKTTRSALEKTVEDLQAALEATSRCAGVAQVNDGEEWIEQECESDASLDIASMDDKRITTALQFLMDSWSTDRSQRMCLHDWIIGGLNHTGLYKPLFLHQVSEDIATAFATLFVPALRDAHGLHIQLRKRTRRIAVTDISLHYDPTDRTKTMQQHLRSHRFIHSLNNFENRYIRSVNEPYRTRRTKPRGYC